MSLVTCARCGEEVRYGIRGMTTGWLHRVDGDHAAILGQPLDPEALAEIDRQYHDIIRRYDDGTAYTTAEHDIMRDTDTARRKLRLAALRGEDPDYVEPLPPPEVPCRSVSPDDFAPRSGIRQILNLIPKQGWELVSCTHARGPYVGSDGSVLSISDSHVVRARGPRVDTGLPVAVASWRDGKFDFAFIGIIKDRRLSLHKADSTTMKNWIKGTHDLSDSLPAPGE